MSHIGAFLGGIACGLVLAFVGLIAWTASFLPKGYEAKE